MASNVELTLVKMRMLMFLRISRQPSPIQIMIDQKQPENVGYISYLGSMITNYARYTREIKYKIAMVKAAFNKALVTSTSDLSVKKELVKCYFSYDAETWTLRKSEIPWEC